MEGNFQTEERPAKEEVEHLARSHPDLGESRNRAADHVHVITVSLKHEGLSLPDEDMIPIDMKNPVSVDEWRSRI